MELIYIAGPFRAKNGYDLHSNIEAVLCAGMAVAKLGLVPVLPHTMYEHFDRTLGDEFWLDATRALLSKCDAMLLVQGWERSAGSLMEQEHAQANGIPVFHSVQQLAQAQQEQGWLP